MRVGNDVDELACFEAGDLGKHVDEHRVLTDVPVVGGEHVLRALIQDGVQRAVRDVEGHGVGAGVEVHVV